MVRAEQFGVPQGRHRVILLGIRDDLEVVPAQLKPSDRISVSDVLAGLPWVRSRLSREEDGAEPWHDRLKAALGSDWLGSVRDVAGNLMISVLRSLRKPKHGFGAEFIAYRPKVGYRPGWFLDPQLKGVCNLLLALPPLRICTDTCMPLASLGSTVELPSCTTFRKGCFLTTRMCGAPLTAVSLTTAFAFSFTTSRLPLRPHILRRRPSIDRVRSQIGGFKENP